MAKVVIIGGGWAGCSAAISARKAGADVIILERTDLLLGLGNVGGIMRNNGRYTAAEEAILLGANDLFDICDQNSRHVDMEFPGHKHASLYDVAIIEAVVRRRIYELGIEVKFQARAIDVEMEGADIKSVILHNKEEVHGDVFIETTGSTGSMGNCLKYGNGCAMCILRCPSFGPRVSISSKAGVEDIVAKRLDGNYGAFSGSCKLNKDSLSEEVVKELNEKGVVVLPVPREDINTDKLGMKVCQQYALDEYAENIILLDTGHAKLMTPFYPLEKLRKIKGLENTRYEDPYSGGVGNSIRYLSIAPRDNALQVKGVGNLFCAGEKSGLFVGHTEAMCTGSLAGHNAVRNAIGLKPIELPVSLAIGDIISFANKSLEGEDALTKRYTFAGSTYFKRMQANGLYTTDKEELKKKIKMLGLEGLFDTKLI